MAVKAQISTGWRIRLFGIAGLFVFMAAYFLYDGFINYPAQKMTYEKWLIFRGEQEEAGQKPAEIVEAWNVKANDEGLPTIVGDGEPLKDYNKSASDILWQKVLGFALIPFALLLSLAWYRTFSRWVSVDDQGVRDSTGRFAPWQRITQLDKTRWPKKGIAWVYFEDAGGAGGEDQSTGSTAAAESETKEPGDANAAAAGHPTQQFTGPAGSEDQRILLDDFKFERQPIEQIVRTIEDHLDDEQIVGDIRETERDQRRKEKEAAKSTGTDADKAGARTSNDGEDADDDATADSSMLDDGDEDADKAAKATA